MNTKYFLIMLMVLLIVPFVTKAGGTAIVTVGLDVSCDYSSITGASFNEPASDWLEIRIPKNYSLPGLELLADRNTTLIGGYDTCNDTTVSGNTVLVGNQSSAIFVAGVSSNTTTRTNLNMVNLEISGGNSNADGGVLSLTGSWELTLYNTTLSFNHSNQNGGALAIEPNDDTNVLTPRVFISDNSILSNNTANGNGGAIACDGGGSVSVWNTQVAFNESDGFGGAVFMNNSCNYYQYGGRLFQGVFFNDAVQSGGGIAALNDSLVYINSNRHNVDAALISSNTAANGGGIFVSGDSRLEAIDATINNNTAIFTGGGIRSADSHVIIRRSSPGAQCHNEVRCSTVSNNTVTNTDPLYGGGAIATFGGTLEITGTYIENNSASYGSAIRARFMPFDFDSNFTMVGNVVAKNRGAQQVIYLDESSGEIAFTTFVDNEDMNQVIEMSYPTTSADGNEVLISGSIFDHSSNTIPSAKLTTAGQLPIGDCNRNAPSSTGDLVAEPRSVGSIVAYEDRAGGDYRLQDTSTFVDFCNGSFMGLGSNYSANGFAKPIDNNISNLHGTYDLGGLERYDLDLIFKDNF